MYFSKFALLAAAGTALAQRPKDTPICDYYTTALLKDNTAANQYTLLTLLVNTVIIGNYTQPNTGVAVPGILAPAVYGGQNVNLLPYFNGCFVSTNGRGPVKGPYDLKNNPPQSVNFLDGGGAAPLKMNKPSNSMNTAQYFLVTHLYEFFGALLGCSQYGTKDFPAYTGEGSMYRVHQYMGLGKNEVGYFISQVGAAAKSFGVADSDISAVAGALNTLFGYSCSPPVTVIPSQGKVLDSICTNANCPKDPHAQCGLYDNHYGLSPRPATASQCMSKSATPTHTKPASYPTSTKHAAHPTTTHHNGGYKTVTETVTKTVTHKPAHQTQMWCHWHHQKGDEHKWCN